MLRIIGIIAVSASCAAYGAMLSACAKKRIEARQELLRLILHIENGIKYGKIPLDSLYNSFDTRILSDFNFNSNCIPQKSTDIGNTFSLLTKNEQDKIVEFFSKLGKSFVAENEIVLCNYYYKLFCDIDIENSKKDSSKIVLYRKLGILCGILAAIIFI